MKKHLAIVAAAAMAVGTASFVFADDNPSNTNTGKTEQSLRNAGASVGIGSADKASEKMTPHAEAIHDTLARVSEAAFKKNGIEDVKDQFTKADRDRLEQNKDALKSDDTYDGRVAEIQKDWKDKYNSSFDIKDEDKIFNMSFASIDEMQAGEAARTASGTVNSDTGTAAPARTDNTNPNATPSDTNANANASDKNRDTAVVHIAASHGLPALDVPMVHEGMKWRIDAPDSVDGAKLKGNLQTALTDLDEHKDQWPADKEDAYRQVTHRVLLAIFDKPATENAPGGANPSNPNPSGTSANPSGSNTETNK